MLSGVFSLVIFFSSGTCSVFICSLELYFSCFSSFLSEKVGKTKKKIESLGKFSLELSFLWYQCKKKIGLIFFTFSTWVFFTMDSVDLFFFFFCRFSYSLTKITFPFKTHKLFKLYIIWANKREQEKKGKGTDISTKKIHLIMCVRIGWPGIIKRKCVYFLTKELKTTYIQQSVKAFINEMRQTFNT